MNQEVDPSNTLMGIDPVFLSVGETLGCGCEYDFKVYPLR
jgi:hypothetical protein